LGHLLGKAALAAWAVILLIPAVALAAGPPQVNASWVTEVTATGAKLRAEINPNGFSTTYRFQYISDSAYRANQEALPPRDAFTGAAQVPPGKEAGIGSGTTPLAVVQSVGSLTPATTYHYRPIATNAAGPPVVGPAHVFTTQETSLVFRLPDNRGWELVSPVDKNGGAIAAPEAIFGGGDIQAAAVAAGENAPSITYGSATSFGEAAGAPPASQYASRRTASGWLTSNISTPLDSAAYGDHPDGAPYRLFSTDLSRALLFGGLACRGGLEGCPAANQPLPGTGAPPGYMAYYMRDNTSGALSSLLDAADVAHSSVAAQSFEVAFAAASPDLSHVVLSSCAALTANATEIPGSPGSCNSAATNLYEWSASGLQLVNLLPGASSGTPGAAIAAPSGAVSGDGSRVYWTQGGNLYLREGAQTVWVDESQGGGGVFQTATPDGSIAFFTKAGHLYRFSAATKAAVDITPAGGVIGVLGASADGSHLYYQDGDGLEHWSSGAVLTVAPGAAVAAKSDYPPATGTSRVSADGLHLAFLSSAELTGYDNTDAATKLPDSELYIYGPPPAGGPAALACASCNPTGERPDGPSTIPGDAANGSTHAYKPRVLSGDGSRLFFDSADELVVQDTNSHPDVYEWEAPGAGTCSRPSGCVDLISSGRGTGGASFLDATADGSDIFFITSESLVRSDPRGSVDAYDARVNGGFVDPPEPIPCLGDSCQSLPGEPDDPTPGTLVPNSGNPPLRFFGPKAKRKHLKLHKHRRHHRKRSHERGGRSSAGGSGR
jgi:hypothetical protein